MNLARMTEHVKNNYIPVTESGCWLWLGSWHKKGYGKISREGRDTLVVSRLFYAYYNGPIPDGMRVCHKCDVPVCCNPDHLFAATDHENAVDKERKSRGRFRFYIPKSNRRAKYKPYIKKGDPS